MSTPLLPPKRCAVYTRVSSDERLDQSFNSLDAQKDAGRAFIASQRAEGWIPVVDDYDDGGYSGGNMERPALRRLLTDIEAGKIDMVVVYKIDRLSRSLADFARMVDVFDRHRVSFSAVTQQINSATSMGRLMLNVLLSFAQFEREVTGERIRDKFAASKAKGMWMGGPVPLGYEVRNRRLVIKEDEAALVRRIFEDFVKVGSATQMVKTYAAEGIKTKGGYTLYQAIDLQDAAQPDLPRQDPPQGPIFPRPAFADHHRGAVGRRPCAAGARFAGAQARGAEPRRRPAARIAVHRRWRTAGAGLHQQGRQTLSLLRVRRAPPLRRVEQPPWRAARRTVGGTGHPADRAGTAGTALRAGGRG